MKCSCINTDTSTHRSKELGDKQSVEPAGDVKQLLHFVPLFLFYISNLEFFTFLEIKRYAIRMLQHEVKKRFFIYAVTFILINKNFI